MADDSNSVKLELHCDLQQAANFYKVDIEEIELRKYITTFFVNEENSNSAIIIECRGCNEQIRAHVIEFPRINNFLSSSFVVQIIIILSIIILPFINVAISDFALYVLIGFGTIVFLNDIYNFVFRPPARLDTLFFWHEIKEVKGNDNDLEKTIEEINLTDEEIWAIHEKLTEGKTKNKNQIISENTAEFEVQTHIKDGEITTKSRKLPDINIPMEDESINEDELENLTIDEIKDILEYNVLESNDATFSEDFIEDMDLEEIAKLLVGEVKLSKKGTRSRDLFATIMNQKLSELKIIKPKSDVETKKVDKKVPETLLKTEFEKFRKEVIATKEEKSSEKKEMGEQEDNIQRTNDDKENNNQNQEEDTLNE